MADTWTTDICHYLDDNGFMWTTMPGPARKMAEYMAAIIEAATARPAGEAWAAAAALCRRRPGYKACPGRNIVRRTQVPAEIVWRCPQCGDIVDNPSSSDVIGLVSPSCSARNTISHRQSLARPQVRAATLQPRTTSCPMEDLKAELLEWLRAARAAAVERPHVSQ